MKEKASSNIANHAWNHGHRIDFSGEKLLIKETLE